MKYINSSKLLLTFWIKTTIVNYLRAA